MFVKLSAEQLQVKKKFLEHYLYYKNSSDSSLLDPNANVTSKNIATLENEINKDINIQINRSLIQNEIKELFGEKLAMEYIRQIESHEIYVHDETSLKPYCVSISMYPFLLNGLKDLGGEGLAPKHLISFCGSFINLVFAIASQFAGAVATVEFLMYFDYFARKDHGDNYLEKEKTLIISMFQHVVYSINQPAAARGYQSVFWNISIYDEGYFKAMFDNFCFPDGTRPNWDTVQKLQVFFMKWFNQERKAAILTYPVITAACLTADGKLKDKTFEDSLAEELAEGNSFFIFMNDNPYALSSCCRLKNDVSSQINEFSYTLGAGGVSTGSINVITVNLNRIFQKKLDLVDNIQKVQKYQVAFRRLIERYKIAKLLPVYEAGFISLDKQYLTIGINGLVEAAESLGYDISLNDEYMNFVENTLKVISDENKTASLKYNCKFNTEFVPAENLGIKNAKWDKKDGLSVNRDCYNSYLYKVEDQDLSILDKFRMHGRQFMKYLDGGSAYHCNLEDYPTKETFKKLLNVAAKEGCEYFCFNIKITICNDCEYIDKKTQLYCHQCKSQNIDYATRIIGYLRRISNFSTGRRIEHNNRCYASSSNHNVTA